jgi:hypothetical protein
MRATGSFADVVAALEAAVRSVENQAFHDKLSKVSAG